MDQLTMSLFAPGMSLLHRAGLGGLACTLKALERQYKNGLIAKAKLPAPFEGDVLPWEITSNSITLRFGKPENAGKFLEKLFAFAFQVRNGLIFLPGQYGEVEPSVIVLSAIQDGIQNTFLQHGPTCGSRSGERTISVEIDEIPMSITHDVFTSYKHQGWFWLERDEKSKEVDPETGKKIKTGKRVQNHQGLPVVTEAGILSGGLHEIDNKLVPGGMVRHDRFNQSAIRETDGSLICLHFALVGCLTLSINRVTAVLLVPEISTLTEFIVERKRLTPQTALQCRIAGATDAALQAQIRLRTHQETTSAELSGCYVMTCRPTQWNQKQKPRVATVHVELGDDALLDKFERALALLPARLVVPKPPETKGRRPSKAKPKIPFWSDSIVRPRIAENLACGRPWYAGFARLMTDNDPATKQPYRNQLTFERKGLHAMIADSKMWDHDGEKLIVQAVQEAMRMRYGQIAQENKSNPVGMRSRMERFRERLRISLAGAKRESDFRFALVDLFSRTNGNAVLQQDWPTILPVLRKDWQLVRDLALLALASYEGKGLSDQSEPNN